MACACAHAEIRDVLRSAEIDQQLGKLAAGGSVTLHRAPGYSIGLKALAEAARHPGEGEDQILWVRRGSAAFSAGATPRKHEIGRGDIVRIGRGEPYELKPAGGRLEYLVVRVSPLRAAAPAGIRPGRREMGDVLKKAEIDATIANSTTNQPIHGAGNFTMNYVIYNGRTGPWEAHEGCVDIYFLERGTAVAQLGGEILNAKPESPGEPRGTGVKGAREHAIAAGDLVLIPRNMAHHMNPGTGKLGYLLTKVWAD